MKVWKIKDSEGVTEKHAEAGSGMGYTLCGLNVVPDIRQFSNEGAISCMSSALVNGRINCQRCIEIIKYCKQIPAKAIKEPS